MRVTNRIALLVATALVIPGTLADEVDRVWAKRYANHLPEWCKYTQELPDKSVHGAYGHPLSKTYSVVFAPAWLHLHHYCRGLSWMYEASKVVNDEAVRRGLYAGVVAECDYVLERSDDTLVLAPEIHYKKGIALMTLGRRMEAVESFTAALAIRADYVPAYLALSQYFERAGDVTEATRVIRQGLERAPDAPQLRLRLAELEGQTPAGTVARDAPP